MAQINKLTNKSCEMILVSGPRIGKTCDKAIAKNVISRYCSTHRVKGETRDQKETEEKYLREQEKKLKQDKLKKDFFETHGITLQEYRSKQRQEAERKMNEECLEKYGLTLLEWNQLNWDEKENHDKKRKVTLYKQQIALDPNYQKNDIIEYFQDFLNNELRDSDTTTLEDRLFMEIHETEYGVITLLDGKQYKLKVSLEPVI